MAKIIIGISGLTGMTNACLAVLQSLEDVGHELLVAAPQDISASISPYEFNFHVLPSINYQPTPTLPALGGPFRKLRLLWHIWWKRKARQQTAIDNCYPAAFIKIVRQFKPDLILLDIELHEYILTAYAQQISVVLLSPWFSTWREINLPPIQSKIIPIPNDEATSKKITKAWDIIIQRRKLVFRRKRWLSGGTDRRSALLGLAKRVRFPLEYIRDNFWPGPITYDHLPVISLAPAALEFPHEQRPALHYIGPIVHRKRMDSSTNTPAIQGIIDTVQKEELKLLYCSVSTMQKGDVNLINKVIAAVAGQAKWQLIVSLGGKNLQGLPKRIPANVHLFDYVPQLKVLAAADCSINHGGIHTINECLVFKVPMLVYSGEHADQNGCAARIAYHQVGLRGNKTQDTPEQIKAKLQQLLLDSSFRQRIAAIDTAAHLQLSKILTLYLHQAL